MNNPRAPLSEDLIYAIQNDPVVNNMWLAQRPLEAIIKALVIQRAAMVNEVIKISSIAPKKIKLPNGEIRIWHCPDHLVPDPL